MAQKLSALPIGAKIKFGTLYGERIVWKVADKNHAGYPDNSVTLVSDQIIKCLCFDEKEPYSTVGNRDLYGDHRYAFSNIRQWLNSAAAKESWYTAQHSTDTPPTYKKDAGFLNAFTVEERSALLDTTFKVSKSSLDGGGYDTCVDKMFLLSNAEVGFGTDPNSSLLKLFENGLNVVATLTASSISNNPDATERELIENDTHDYWLRDFYGTTDGVWVNLVKYDKTSYPALANTNYVGLRPVCNLSADLLASDNADSSGCYTVIYNRAPSSPSFLNVPEKIYEGENANVSWGLSTDEDGNLAGYVLEQKVNSNAWETVYTGPGRSYDVPVLHGVDTVQYRVKAYDTDNASSSYVTSSPITLIKNRAPVISGEDEDLGTFVVTPPSFTYAVSDADTDAVNVVEKFDGKIIKEYAVTLDTDNTVTFTADAWRNVVNGQHTFEITATDAEGGVAVRTKTFTKNVDTIEFVKNVAVETSAMPTRALVNIVGHFPAGCVLNVWMCNNGNDEAPTWEDVTQNAIYGEKYYFENTVKTASTWGVKVKVKLARGTATETCYIQSVGANFA
ncbi:MAG: fibronectin type III domain-containing protein [Oscillospiraceae bacterium]|nr:fibronectin type III domain-containing protein [Oscillospiraceae bacterium]MBQ3560918.1 fibronectin type III domain-containing protein [Oscillospiraceae bacterium]